MEKKEQLHAATQTIAIAKGDDNNTAKKTGTPSIWARIGKWIRTKGTAIKNWIKGGGVGGLTTMLLLCSIIVLFTILVINIWDVRESNRGAGGSHLFNNAAADASAQPAIATRGTDDAIQKTTVTADVTIDQATDEMTITLPLRRAYPKRTADTESGNVVYLDGGRNGDIIIDGRDPNGNRLGSMTTIRGNVFLQNMHTYALPCGIKIDGNLLIRNVGMLRFCGCFEVTGNIYVSSKSSFGPMPYGSRLGGQIIF